MSKSTTMSKSSVILKLLIDIEVKRVMFAKADKDCVDFLFYILTFSVAVVMSLLRKQGMVGLLVNLYESLKNLNESYILSNQNKDILLKLVSSPSVPLLLNDAPSSEKMVYVCPTPCALTVTDDPHSVCPNCCRKMTINMSYLCPPAAALQHATANEGVYVKGVVTYMLMDNLVVKPMCTISSITLLNQFNVKEIGKLEEKVVHLGMQKAMDLLKASLQSEKVLTDVFLKGKGVIS